jgi:hypothetical protein
MWATRLARWWGLIGPGCLLAQALCLLALLGAPRLVQQAFVADDLKLQIVVLIGLHVVMAALARRQPLGLLAMVGFALLAGDAQLSGLLLGRDASLCSPAMAVAVVTALNIVAVGGWLTPALGVGFFAIGLRMSAVQDLPVASAWLPRLTFDTALAVDPTFGSSAAVLVAHPGATLNPPLICLLPLAVGFGCWILGAAFNLGTMPRQRHPQPALFAAMLLLSILFPPQVSAASACRDIGRTRFVEGLLALSHHDLAAAYASFYRLTKEQPSCAEARNNLAVVLAEMGRFQEAAAELEAVSRLQPGYGLGQDNLQRLAELRTTDRSTPRKPTDISLPTVRAIPSASRTRTPSASPTPTRTASSLPPSIVAVEPEGSIVCVIDRLRQELCTYRRQADGITRLGCLPAVATGVGAQPRWLIAGERSAHHLWFFDAAGHRRVLLASGVAPSAGAVLSMPSAAFQLARQQLVLWTMCVVDPGTSSDAAEPASQMESLRDALAAWRAAWAAQRFADYQSFYSDAFVPQMQADRALWQARTFATFDPRRSLSIELGAASLFAFDGGATAVVAFEQRYQSRLRRTAARKVMQWRREGSHWRIVTETTLQEAALPPKR